MSRPRVDFGLVLLHPQELGRGETGERHVAGDLDEALLRLGALVVPQDGRTQDFARRIEQHQPVHLPGQPDGGDVCPADAAFGQRLADGARRCLPPFVRILFGPEGMGNLEGVRADGCCYDVPPRVDQQRFAAGRRNVESQEILHGCLRSGREPGRSLSTGQKKTRCATLMRSGPTISKSPRNRMSPAELPTSTSMRPGSRTSSKS